jgi:large subunit ribosomal protein L25
MQIEFKASKRTLTGSGASRRLRRDNKIPGIVYGGSAAPEQIEMDHNDLYHALRKEAFHASVLAMNLDGEKQMVLLRDVQMHAYRPIVMHLDFQRVDATHAIHQKVPLHFVNAEVSPGVKLQGGVASHVMNEIDVKCLPGDLPEFIEVDLSQLAAGASLHLSQIQFPKGVEPVLHKGEDPVVAAVILPRGAVAEEAGGEEAGAEGEKK